MIEIVIRQAPLEMGTYLGKLIKVVGYEEPVVIAVISPADMPAQVGVTEKPDGFLHLEPGSPPLIVLRDNLEDTRWQFVVAHEFLHLLRWTIDEWVLRRLPPHEHDTYMRLVEDTMKPLTILLMVGGMMNAEWVDET